MKKCKEKVTHRFLLVDSNADMATYRVTIRIPLKMGWIERVKLLVEDGKQRKAFVLNHLKNTDWYAYFQLTIELETKAIYHYCFSFEANGQFQYYKKSNATNLTSINKSECWKLSVNFYVPGWAKGAIMYHIFVDRYRRGSKERLKVMPNRTIHKNWHESPILGPDENGNWNIDFFGGDLKGIEETLDYLKKMGVTIIYLSPIVRSQSNHRYDTGNYEEVDPYAGTNEVLKELCDTAHRKGMYIILDAVFNHTGNDSKYFNEYGTYDTVGAYQSENSPYYEFFKKIWRMGNKSFSFWWGMPNLPECDGNSKKWKEYILGENGVIDKWFELGINGLRLDVADELTDEFIEGIRVAARRRKEDVLIIGEVWKNPMRMNRGYIESGKGMDTVMNYLLVDALIRYFKYSDVQKLRDVIQEILVEYPTDTIFTLMNFTSTHDISRAIEIFACDCYKRNGEWGWNLLDDSLNWISKHKLSSNEYKYGKEVYKAYMFALAFMPGILSIFYGDEVGVTGIGNLLNRATYPWGRRDKDLLNFFRSVCKTRNKEKFLKTAELRIIKIDAEQFIFERFSNRESILVATSRTHHETELVLPEEYSNAEILLNKKESTLSKLAPYGAIVLKKH